jgi:hypothetical protein
MFAIVLAGIWFAMQWAAAHLVDQPELGAPCRDRRRADLSAIVDLPVVVSLRCPRAAPRRGADEVRDVQNVADMVVDPEGALDRCNHGRGGDRL